MRPLPALAAALIMLAMTLVPAAAQQSSAFEHEFEAIEGGKMPLGAWRGKALLVVNTASFCGYTPQYEGLQKLWERYEAKGLVVVGVPSNDFGAQEPKSEAEILGFCKGAYNVTFPLTAKFGVKGRGRPPLLSLGARRPGCRQRAGMELPQVPRRPRRQADRRLRLRRRAAVAATREGDRGRVGGAVIGSPLLLRRSQRLRRERRGRGSLR